MRPDIPKMRRAEGSSPSRHQAVQVAPPSVHWQRSVDRAILRGGLLRGVYLVEGMPGSGKSILGNQLAFAHAAAGGRVVYLTMVSESHARMFGHLRALSFYDGAIVGAALYYESGFQTLEEEGLAGLLEITRRAVRDREATLLVIDGLATNRELVGSGLDLRRFIQQLQLFLEAVGCTAVVLTRPAADSTGAEHTMADGIIELRDERGGIDAHRTLTVPKFRGRDMLRGDHSYALTGDGMIVSELAHDHDSQVREPATCE